MVDRTEYERAAAAYTSQLRDVLAARAPVQARGAAGGAGDEALADRADQLPLASRLVGEMTAGYLVAEEQGMREAAELKLLAQATAEVEVARMLLDTATQADSPATTRGAVSTPSQEIGPALEEALRVLESPIEPRTLAPVAVARGGADQPADLATALEELRARVDTALAAITERATSVCGQAARDLVGMDAALLYRGVRLISADAARLLDEAVAGLGRLARRIATSGLRLLLQAFDWVLALLGQDTEQQARRQVGNWIDELRQQGQAGVGPVAGIVDRVYAPATIREEVAGWLSDPDMSVERVYQAAQAVQGLAEAYQAKTQQVERLLDGIALARRLPLVATPQGQVVAAALMLGLLGYTLYTGYDHVDSGRVVFASRFGIDIPDRVEGIRETVQKAVGRANT